MVKLSDFNIEEVFNVDDYMYFYSEKLTEERTKREVEFLVKVLELKEPKRILDLACGFGRHAIKLAELGHEVVGVDIMEGFLEIARKKAEEQGVSIKFMKGDMRETNFKEEFDIVLLLYTSFGYFSDEENFKVLQNVYKALKPNGLFCLDVPNRDFVVQQLSPCSVLEKGEDFMIDMPSFDVFTGRMNVRRITIRNGRRREVSYSIRLYTFTEVKELLKRAEFEVYKVFGHWDGRELSLNAPRMIVVAQKV
ncbi:methyltransferase domain-containing protein [Thermococcus argininiproducens]|uniref:Methyltransferase domain-containing protein n=1 Tax=Thermococcus argininiproducens TaxID=2866384 RepID=A0A9E7M9G2_9EURY|nr:class I SAM-dependent methyltransferase [Thermococcus argininiproducens]USG99540.1 methyltransferase domain-containing protein [Thermococcus argininiproducens]